MAADIYHRITKHIVGRIAVTRAEAEYLASLVKGCDLYLEIGCLWGGTAILASMAGAKRVISVDSMNTSYYTAGDPASRRKVTAEAILGNLVRFHVAHRVHLVKAASDPWPLPPTVRPDVALIDGDHSYEACLADWNNVRQIADPLVVFHDYTPRHPGVWRVIEEHVKADPGWKLAGQAETLVAYRRAYGGA